MMIDKEHQINAPKTVWEMVDRLISNWPLNDKVNIANMAFDELDSLHFSLGNYIRNEFGLWGEKKHLLDSCRSVSDEKEFHPDTASTIIIMAFWEKLRKTHRLSAVK